MVYYVILWSTMYECERPSVAPSIDNARQQTIFVIDHAAVADDGSSIPALCVFWPTSNNRPQSFAHGSAAGNDCDAAYSLYFTACVDMAGCRHGSNAAPLPRPARQQRLESRTREYFSSAQVSNTGATICVSRWLPFTFFGRKAHTSISLPRQRCSADSCYCRVSVLALVVEQMPERPWGWKNASGGCDLNFVPDG